MQGLQNLAALVGRILISAIFLWSGFGKIMNFDNTVGYVTSVGLPMAYAGTIIAIIIEVIGGLCILFGFQTRFSALVVAIFSVAAAFAFHSDFADVEHMQKVHFFKNLAIAGGLLQIFAFGPGSISIDRRN